VGAQDDAGERDQDDAQERQRARAAAETRRERCRQVQDGPEERGGGGRVAAREPERGLVGPRTADEELEEPLEERRADHEADPEPPAAPGRGQEGEQQQRGGKEEPPVARDVHDAQRRHDGGRGEGEQAAAHVVVEREGVDGEDREREREEASRADHHDQERRRDAGRHELAVATASSLEPRARERQTKVSAWDLPRDCR
jgi:hypothetical protein